jgi:hypothetical protein
MKRYPVKRVFGVTYPLFRVLSSPSYATSFGNSARTALLVPTIIAVEDAETVTDPVDRVINP